MKYLLNKNRKIGLLGLLALLFITYSCSDLSSVNENPNEPSEAATPYLLTSAQKSLADSYWGEFELGYFGNLYAQYWSQNQYTQESRYSYRTGVVNNIWNSYFTTLNTIEQIIQQNRDDPSATSAYGNNANQIAIAKILKAWTFHTMTDIWGDIPFDDALQGAENPSPEYTPQSEVYEGIIEMLTEASDSIVVGSNALADGDLFYGGDMEQWRKLANSLKMRAGIRIADVAPDLAETAISEAIQAGVMESNEDNALFTYLSETPNNNPINEAYKTRSDFAVSEPLMDYMQSNDDPRISAYAAPADIETDDEGNPVDTTYAGFPYGMAQGNATVYVNNQDWSPPSQRVRAATAPAIFMTYSEVLFTGAEAVERFGINAADVNAEATSAEDLYGQAITASMEYWDVAGEDGAAAETYINNNPYNPGDYEESIGQEKWVALYMQGIQGWSEWRRLDFGILQPPAGGKLGVSFDAPIALRYPYPIDEANSNSENLQAAIDRQMGDLGWSADDQGQRLWWDEE